jgi:hypothetical protein
MPTEGGCGAPGNSAEVNYPTLPKGWEGWATRTNSMTKNQGSLLGSPQVLQFLTF